jgi:hypothetical protein
MVGIPGATVIGGDCRLLATGLVAYPADAAGINKGISGVLHVVPKPGGPPCQARRYARHYAVECCADQCASRNTDGEEG